MAEQLRQLRSEKWVNETGSLRPNDSGFAREAKTFLNQRGGSVESPEPIREDRGTVRKVTLSIATSTN